ncbi:MAG: hypothetical protein LBE71_06465 [Dysgonamonadaceae bacterium]|nr:hypothetical protein [Dysgonamonadaceae bacterium]
MGFSHLKGDCPFLERGGWIASGFALAMTCTVLFTGLPRRYAAPGDGGGFVTPLRHCERSEAIQEL